MAKTNWSFYSPSTLTFTSKVLSASYTTGRATQYDTYSPGGLTITIDNSANYVANFDLADSIRLTDNLVGAVFEQYFWISSIELHDEGNTGMGSTAVLHCTDLLGRLGRTQVFEQALTGQPTLDQIFNEFNSLVPSSSFIFAVSPGDSTAAGLASFTGTVLDRINLNMATEQGLLVQFSTDLYLFARSDLASSFSALTFDRTTSGTYQIGYSSLQRSGIGENYINAFTVTPTVATPQNAINTVGQSTYGIYTGELATVDNTTAQALSLAQWMTYSRSDPADLSFTITFNDLTNDMTGFYQELSTQNFGVTVKYKVPGGSTTITDYQLIQGWGMEMTPEQTTFTVFTSPLTFYNYFTLDSATNGILGGAAVTYNEATITYNEGTFIYNESSSVAGSRLGF